MRLAALALILAAALGGCAEKDRLAATQFKPTGPATFEYDAKADVSYPASSENAETDRMAWLKTYLDDNGLCPKGYEITGRNAVLLRHAILGDVHQIYYTGRCKT